MADGQQMVSEATRNWDRDLTEALEHANLPTLLMVLVHLTGDVSWLSPRYRCTKPRGLEDNDSGGLSDEVQREIRTAARAALLEWRDRKSLALRAPDLPLIARMMASSVGEEVSTDYAAMIAAGLGLDPEFRLTHGTPLDLPADFSVVVIGAGIAGVCMAIRLKSLGIPFVVVEKNAHVGGTWYENRYPGAGVDTPSHLYSYSFAKHDWSQYFAMRDEIEDYVESVEATYGLSSHIRFETRVESAEYDDEGARWSVRVIDSAGQRETLEPTVLISAVGLLNVPKIPEIEGLDSFRGRHFHSARWPEDLSVTGQRVAVVGNGASAMQIVPAIADKVARVVVFQRSKQWAAPFEQFHQRIADPVRFLLREVPLYQEWYRQRLGWIFNDRIHASLQIDPEWPHMDRSINARNDRHRAAFTDYIRAELGARQDLLDDVLPDYPPFGKRMLMDNGWYRTVTRQNVELVNEPIVRVEPDGIVTADGKSRPADVLVLATGFDAINVLSSFQLRGRGGLAIREVWRDGAQAYLGVAAPCFPNFFMLTGPNTALGHGGSVVPLIETQVRYIAGILTQAMTRAGGRFEIEVRRDVHDDFNEKVQAAHKRMIWSHRGMSNWYRNAAGRVIATTPFRNDDYWHMMRRTELSDYVVTPVDKLGPAARLT